MDLVLHPRTRLDQLRAPRDPAAHHPPALVRHPHTVQRSGGQQLGQRQGVQAIGLRPGMADTRVTRGDHDHPLDVRLDDPRDLASRSAPRNARCPPRRSRPHRSHGAHPTRSLSPPLPSPTSPTTRENCGPTTPTDPRSQRNQASRKGRPPKSRARSPSSKAACPRCVLPKAPRDSGSPRRAMVLRATRIRVYQSDRASRTALPDRHPPSRPHDAAPSANAPNPGCSA